jgi:Ca2+-binding RTX toxin-like protein
MGKTILARKHETASGAIVLLAAVLAALLVAFIAARPSEAADPILTVDPTTVGFGAVEVGTTGDPIRTVTIRNTSGTDLVLGGVTLLGADAGQFSILNPIPVTGVTLGTDGVYTLQVAFSPTTNGTKTADLGFNVVGGGGTLPTATVTGTGVNQPPTSQQGAQGCTIVGTRNGETLTGTSAHDVICGLGGADKINGLGANDVLKGGSGKDRIIDHRGKDKLLGQGGRDTLNSRDHARGDVIKGGAGKDRAIKDKRDRARSI